MSELVVFDCDGTLVDSQHAIIEAVDAAFGAHGLPAPEAAAVRRIVGLSVPEALDALLEQTLGPAHGYDAQELAGHFRQRFMAVRARGGPGFEPLFPGVRAALDRLADAGIPMAVATGKSRRGAEATLANHGLEHHFLCVETADAHPSKPHPAMLQAAVTAAGAEPARTVIVGDTSYDMMMGRAAGTGRLGVGWGYHSAEDLFAAGADAIVETADELTGRITALLS